MTHNIYDSNVSLKLEYNLGCSIRDNKYKLHNCTFCHDLRKYYYSARIIKIWNSLPNCVVDVSTINQFKARLDKFWMHQDVLYDYTQWRRSGGGGRGGRLPPPIKVYLGESIFSPPQSFR